MFAISKRIFFFVLVNILVLVTISISWRFISAFFGISAVGYGSLVFFCLAFGMGGAFVSLLISKWMAKKMMGVKIIDPRTSDHQARELVELVHGLARAAGLRKMPEVGVYQSPEINAFATGPTKNNSLVAVSSGLLNRMNKDQVHGVLGHEVAHIANGDMVTMTLLQGVINALVLFFARILANLISSQMDDRARPLVHFGLVIALEIVLSILGAIVVNFFSRWREYRADAGGARLAGRDRMVTALRALAGTGMEVDTSQEAMATLKISGSRRKALAFLFSTHPPIEDRIRRLETSR